jgi:hypothetical protein
MYKENENGRNCPVVPRRSRSPAAADPFDHTKRLRRGWAGSFSCLCLAGVMSVSVCHAGSAVNASKSGSWLFEPEGLPGDPHALWIANHDLTESSIGLIPRADIKNPEQRFVSGAALTAVSPLIADADKMEAGGATEDAASDRIPHAGPLSVTAQVGPEVLPARTKALSRAQTAALDDGGAATPGDDSSKLPYAVTIALLALIGLVSVARRY